VAAVYGQEAARAAVGTVYRHQLWGSLEETGAAADSRIGQYMRAYSIELRRRGSGSRSSRMLHERRMRGARCIRQGGRRQLCWRTKESRGDAGSPMYLSDCRPVAASSRLADAATAAAAAAAAAVLG
jgi:hypothetical protein